MTTQVVAPAAEAAGATAPSGVGPFRLAWRRLRRNKVAMTAGAIFIVLVALCLLAPVYSAHIAHIGPNTENISGTITINGVAKPIFDPKTFLPIGPTWHSQYFLGADSSGRDLAVRLLYGGRTSLEIGFLATVITMVGAIILGVLAGYFRGWVDTIISRVLDLIWAYPALLLGIALGVSLAAGNGISIGPLHLTSGSNFVPAGVIGVVYIPYVARPLRGEVLTLREREFIDAAVTLGYGRFRTMVSEVLPNLTSIMIVFFALQLAQSIILEASLSFLGAGVQPPNASWGTMLADGSKVVTASPHLVLVPGAMLVATLLSVNILGDGVRQAFDPRARIRER